MSANLRQQNVLKSTLKELALNQKEVDVFLLMTQLGKATAGTIAKNTPAIPRTSVYEILNSLQQAGLVSTAEENNKKYFQVTDLEHVIDALEYQKRELTEKQDMLRSVSDIFEQMKSGASYQPHIRFFQGKNGILAIQRELQNARKETRTIADIASVAKTFPQMLREDNLKDFQTYHIPKKDLIVKTPQAEQYLKVAPVNEFHLVKWLPRDVHFQTDTLIWAGHVAILDYSTQLSGVIIDNPTIADTFVAWFEMMWRGIAN